MPRSDGVRREGLEPPTRPLELLPAVVDAVGDRAEVFLDGGVRGGADVAAAVAMGARAVFVARPYLYALMAGGEAGVDHLLGFAACGLSANPATARRDENLRVDPGPGRSPCAGWRLTQQDLRNSSIAVLIASGCSR